MRINSYFTYSFLTVTAIIGILILLSSKRINNDQYSYKIQYTNFFVHPEKYNYGAMKFVKLEFNGKDAFIDTTDAWTEVIPGVYIHSAFADENSNETTVRIMAVIGNGNINTSDIKCLLQNNSTIWKEPLTIGYQWSVRYLTLICRSKHPIIPQKIALESKLEKNKSNWLVIHHQNQKNISKHEIAVCVQPLSTTFKDIELLAEFISYYDVVGISSFVIYDDNMKQTVKDYINMVSRSGINITIVPWTMPNNTAVQNKKALQLASIQHCIYRSRSKYVLPVNYDEFLIPRQHNSLIELMDELSTISKRNIGSYIFHKSYFCPQNATFLKNENYNLVSSRDIFKEEKIWPSKERSKYIVRPESVIEGGLNYIRSHGKNFITATVPWQLALIHHYASCPKQKYSAKLIEDRTAESFTHEILLSKAMIAFKEFKSDKT